MIHASTVGPEHPKNDDIWIVGNYNYQVMRYAANSGMWFQQSKRVRGRKLTPEQQATMKNYLPLQVNDGAVMNFVETTLYEICGEYEVDNNFRLVLTDTEHAKFLLKYT